MVDFKLFINFKTYPQGTGERAIELAKVCEEVGVHLEGLPRGEIEGVEVIAVVQVVDIFQIKKEVKIPVWVQHVDPQPQGQFTGWMNLEAAVEAGASGTLLNHSEHQIPPGAVKQILARVQSSKLKVKSFETMVCCKTLGQMERLVKLKPDYIGYEISELIGKKVSIINSNLKTIKHAVRICQDIPLIVGAGIHKPNDLAVAKRLGTGGVLISSAVVLSDNPKEKLLELVKAISN